MKKYFITSLLLAAGTLLGNAATGTITLEEVSNTSPITAVSVISFEGLEAIVKNVNTNKALLGITTGSGTTNTSWAVSVGSWRGTNQLHIYNKQAGESISGNANASFTYSIEGVESPGSDFNIKTYFDLENKEAVKGALAFGYAGDHAAQVASGTAVALSVLYKDGSTRSIYGVCARQKMSGHAPISITYATELLNSPVVTTTVDWSQDTLVAASLSAIPEPSAFGLLAGVGALALVTSRRRRK